MRARDKIRTVEGIEAQLRSLRADGRRVVFTNGCFDLLHVGHVRYLEEAASHGDCLIVGLNTDASVQRIKGPRRPVVDEAARSEVVAALACVDFVALFDTPDPLPLILRLRPDVLVKGADWALENIVGAKEVMAWGGSVVRVPLVAENSTTALISRILDRYGVENEQQPRKCECPGE